MQEIFSELLHCILLIAHPLFKRFEILMSIPTISIFNIFMVHKIIAENYISFKINTEKYFD